MKILIIVTLLIFIETLHAIAADQKLSYSYLPKEYVGYMLYDAIDKYGKKTEVRVPVKYKLNSGTYALSSDKNNTNEEDSNISYRDCRIELDKTKQKLRNKLTNPAFYPLYFND